MKKVILLLLLAVCAAGIGFSQEEADIIEESGKGNSPIIIFATIFVVVALILLLRLATEKMKTKKGDENKS